MIWTYRNLINALRRSSISDNPALSEYWRQAQAVALAAAAGSGGGGSSAARRCQH
jgi:hypothetical protein